MIPTCINKLTNLKALEFDKCQLNYIYSVPDTLWQLTGLEILNLRDDKLYRIPSGIGVYMHGCVCVCFYM